MSAVSAIGLQLCPMATSEKCYNDSTITTSAFQSSSLTDKRLESDYHRVNVYVSTIINHNNITINGDKGINIDTMTVNATSTTELNSSDVLQKLFPKHFEYLRSSINDIEEVLPKTIDYVKANISNKQVTGISTEDTYVDPCSHPEYIVFTWVSNIEELFIV